MPSNDKINIDDILSGASSPLFPQITSKEAWDNVQNEKLTSQRWNLDLGRRKLVENGDQMSSAKVQQAISNANSSNVDPASFANFQPIENNINTDKVDQIMGSGAWQKIVSIAEQAGTSPSFILIAMAFESNLNPASNSDPAHPENGNWGLIQIDTNDLHYIGFHNMTGPDFGQLSSVQQLDPYIRQYFVKRKPYDISFPTLYMTIHWPLAGVTAFPLDKKIYDSSTVYWRDNPLFQNSTGIATKGSVATVAYKGGIAYLKQVGILKRG